MADKEASTIKKELNTEDGVKYYEQYLGKAAKNNSEVIWTTYAIMLNLTVAVLITSVIVFVFKTLVNWIFRSEKQVQM